MDKNHPLEIMGTEAELRAKEAAAKAKDDEAKAEAARWAKGRRKPRTGYDAKGDTTYVKG